MKIAIVGGTWDNNGGKTSSIVNQMYEALSSDSECEGVISPNGGFYTDLSICIDQIKVHESDIIFWLANVPNEFAKYNDVKAEFPKAMLITSKNNYDKQYTFQEMVAHALSLKSNLFIEVTKKGQLYCGQVFDPLGNAWTIKTVDFVHLAIQALRRAIYLKGITRKPTIWSPEVPYRIPLTDENVRFFDIVKKSANKFHELIHPADGVERFLGNASFRCMNGFPSLRSTNGNIYVSRRNVDKRALGPDEFVQVGYNRSKDITWYRGEHKPSVDTVVQVQLYQQLPKTRFMMHSHVYVKSAPFTKNMVPCGGVEEVREIAIALSKHGVDVTDGFAVNLIGHGSLICAQTPEDFGKFNYIQRPTPELLYVQQRKD